MRRKVVVLGWDGASFDLAQQWADEGLLPTLARMRANGVCGRLASTIPPVSAPAWASFITGNNPGRHGIYYFKQHIPGTYETRLVRGSDRRTKPIWRMLNEQGRKIGAVNLVMSYPPEPVDGFIVSGMDTPSQASEFTYPPELKRELLQRLGNYIIEWPLEEEARTRRYDKLWSKITTKLENRIQAVRYLLGEKEWDVFVVNFRATDDVQHHFWKFMDPAHPQHDAEAAGPYRDCILRIYQRLDEFAGEVRAGLASDTVFIVMSDHGFGPTSDKVLYLNNWLAQHGWLTWRHTMGKGMLSHSRLPYQPRSLVWQSAWERLRQIVPQRVKDALERLSPRLYQRIRYPAAYFFIDWKRTQAYADEYQESIWINLAGREPEGIVQPGGEYERLRDDIVHALREWTDPLTSMPAIELACRREEIYHGPELEKAPDIVMIPRQEPYFRVRPSHTSPDGAPMRTLSREELRAEYLPNGTHRLYGMLYAEGPGIAAGRRIEGMSIMDMAPTILHLAGCHVPRGLDGRVITEMFEEEPDVEMFDDEELLDFRPAVGISYTQAEAELVAEKLRGLGYLD